MKTNPHANDVRETTRLNHETASRYRPLKHASGYCLLLLTLLAASLAGPHVAAGQTILTYNGPADHGLLPLASDPPPVSLSRADADGNHDPERPQVLVSAEGPNMIRVEWPYPTPGFILQSSGSLSEPDWSDVHEPAQVDGPSQFVILPRVARHRFFRLRSGCLDFTRHAPGSLPNPWTVGGATFLVHDFTGAPAPTAAISSFGSHVGLNLGTRTHIDLAHRCLLVELSIASYAGPVRASAYDAAGNLLDTASTATSPTPVSDIGLHGGGSPIAFVEVEAPQNEALLLKLCCYYRNNPFPGFYNPYGVPVDPANVINAAVFDENAEVTAFGTRDIDPEQFSRDPFPVGPKDDDEDPNPRPPGKISPVLEEWIANRDPNDVVELLVVFPEDLRLPLLPDLQPDERREDLQTRRNVVIANLARARFRSQMATLDRIQEQFQAETWEPIESHWLVNAMRIRTELGSVIPLSKLDDIQYLQPRLGGESPPDGNPDNDAQDGRRLIVSDPYANLNQTSPWMGLLDTGVRDTHTLFNSPRHIAWMRDCVNGGVNCNETTNPGYDPTDFAWDHGTRSAAVLMGNSRLGSEYRGVTRIRTDSWQIYTATTLDGNAAVRGIQAGIAAFDKVLVGEIQAIESDNGTIATAADNAYDTGVIFISANGNYGPNSATVASPGIAHKVIGVGGFMTDGGAQYNAQGRGPSNDGRYKPDIQAPTWSETASAASDTALGVYTGTSGATPYAAGAAMLARNWLRNLGTFDNGQTYAFMILYGDNPYPYNHTVGAGKIKMAVNGHAWWGKLNIANGVTVNIPIHVMPGRENFDAALWWPESASQLHNDIDIHLIDPSGAERARGYSGVSVFERARVGGPLAEGTWHLRIRGFRVRTAAQTVYWAAHIRN